MLFRSDGAAPAPAGGAPGPVASAGGRVRLAPPPFVAEFRAGDLVLTAGGLEVDESTADRLRAAARHSGIQLREL